jgi:hypothetical protein
LLNQHLDHSNKDFNLKDLENLVSKSKNDLEDVDKKRRVEFQQYEMQKELERRIMLQVILYFFEFESFSTFSIKENGYE